MDSETEKIKKVRIDSLKKLLSNGSPELLLLIVMLKHKTTIGNTQIYNSVGPDWILSQARLSQARAELERKGILRKTRTLNRTFFEVDTQLEPHCLRLVEAAFNLLDAVEKNKDYTQVNRLSKRGIIKKPKEE